MTNDGGWAIDDALYEWLISFKKEKHTILELGSGIGTDRLSKYFNMYSIEHDEKWVNKYNSTYIHAPLKEHKAIRNHAGTLWYDVTILRQELPKVPMYDILLIDGPPTYRAGLLKYFRLFDINAMWVFDDLHRDGERKIIHSISASLKRPYIVHNASGPGKPFGVI